MRLREITLKEALERNKNIDEYTIFWSGNTDKFYAIDSEAGVFFEMPFKPRKLPRKWFGDQDPGKLPEPREG